MKCVQPFIYECVVMFVQQFPSLASVCRDKICPLSTPRYSKLYFTFGCGTTLERASADYHQIKSLVCQPGVKLEE